MRSLGATLILWLTLAWTASADFNPGRTTSLTWPGFEQPFEVFVPFNYSPDESWPIVFHYHTQGMGPNTLLPRTYTLEKDFIAVGMSYQVTEVFSQDADFFAQQMQVLRDVRTHLAKEGLKIDSARTYLGGVGLGGWYASYFADLYLDELSGVYIISAGVFSGSKLKGTRTKNPIPVYLGVAQLEPNHSFAINAKEHFRKLGARVTFDEYLGKDHTLPVPPNITTSKLMQWFSVEANRKTPEEGREAVAKWEELVHSRLAELETPLDQFLFCEHLVEFPYYPALSAELRREIGQRYKTLSEHPDLRQEISARSAYLRTVHEETLDHQITSRRRIAHAYVSILERFPKTHYGMRAGIAAVRLKDLVENPDRWQFNSAEQQREFLEDAERRPLPSLPKAEGIQEMMRAEVSVFLN